MQVQEAPRILKLASKIKQLRIQAGYSSHELFAYDNNIPRAQYWRIEKGANFSGLRGVFGFPITLAKVGGKS